jgi:hypothetical protein
VNENKNRLYGDVSVDHERDFLFIRGVYGCKNNGDALEKIIELALPLARKEVAARKAPGSAA